MALPPAGVAGRSCEQNGRTARRRRPVITAPAVIRQAVRL